MVRVRIAVEFELKVTIRFKDNIRNIHVRYMECIGPGMNMRID